MPGRAPAGSWGWPVVVLALGAALCVHFGLRFAIPEAAQALGFERSFRDAGDLFEQAGRFGQYADERLRAATLGLRLPDPPQLRGDVNTARLAYAAGALDLAVIGGIALFVMRGARGGPLHDLGLDRPPGAHLSRPIIAAALAVGGLALYGLAVSALEIDMLEPGGAAPATVLRDTPALVLFGVVTVAMAPLAEELLFRGMLMRGLLRLGPLPAIALSGVAFAAWHLSPQALPLVAVGCILGWLYYTSGSLWQPLLFHVVFNLVAFVQFASGR
jgi:membrane protease YdiL (CAAX protease family)